MKSLIRLAVFLIFSTFSSQIFAQGISGKIIDSDKFPVPGVNIVTEDKSASAVSDMDGSFTINVAPGTKLKFSMIGYDTVTKSAAANMSVNLVSSDKVLQEVVVVGYGTRKKGAITGSVSQIKSEDIVRTPTQSAVQGIQGKAAGINIVTNDEPGANPSIRIRGLGTLLGGRDPLYVVDGVEMGNIANLNSNDIATIDVLKDGSSLAIYGQKGANGVVLVTTKRGKSGALKVSYSSYIGQKSILTKVKMADSYRYAYYSDSALGMPDYFNLNQPYNTDWLEEITRKGEVTNNSIALSGGNENANYYYGISHYTEKGVLLGTDFKKTNLLSKNEYKIAEDRLKVTSFVSMTLIHNTPKPLSAFTNAYKQAPIIPVRYPNGRWGAPFLNKENGRVDLNGTEYDNFNKVANPVAQLANTNEANRGFELVGSLNAELKLYKDLKFNSNFGATATWKRGYTFTDLRENYLTADPFSDDLDYNATFGPNPVRNNLLQQRREDSFNYNWDNYLTYKKQIGNHSITAIAGMSKTISGNSDYINASRYNVPVQDNYWQLNFSNFNVATAPLDVVQNERETTRLSLAYFGRLEYEYKDKYLLTAIVRQEGISSFQKDKRWYTFPSLSVGWVISNEEFLKGSSFINNLKIRGGYGTVGNGNGPSYNNIAFTTNKNYSFGVSSIINPGAFVASAIDPNLTWEIMKELDMGLDFSILNNKLSGSFDYYERKNDNIILRVQLPEVLSEEATYINSGEITNTGYEVSLKWEDDINDNLRYWIAGNFSQNKNKLSRIDSQYFDNFANSGSLGNGETTKLIKLNQPVGSFYVFEQTGYDDAGAPIYNDMVDGVAGLTDNDRINAGSYIPDYTYGVNLGFVYRSIDFSVDTYGVGGNKLYNGKKAQRQGNENVEYDILDDFWTPSNPNAENPKPFSDRPKPSTYYVEKGDYLRINNITLGYTLPKMFDKLDKVRCYVTAVNPFIFTEYSGYSPELVGNNNADPLGTAGIEIDAYPTNKTFLFGLNVNF